MVDYRRTVTSAPGPLLASGRAADVHDQGDGTVLRRYKHDHDVEHEVAVMRWVAEAGYPVPRVVSGSGRDIVMERIDGPTMLDDIGRRRWMLVAHARTLAQLHHQLHRLMAPDWLRRPDGTPEGRAVLHLDLHPLNVLITPDGPVVIDWTNAARGEPSFDAAMTVALIESYEIDSRFERMGRWVLLRSYELAYGRRAVSDQLDTARRRRLADANTTEAERSLLRRRLGD